MHAEMSPGFASLQLRLVERFVALGLGTHADGAKRLTNFRRRLGLRSDSASEPRWADVLDAIESAATHADRVAAVMSAWRSLPPAVPEHIANGWPTVGAFSIETSGPVARTHFYSMDDDNLSPLHPSKLDARRNELRSVLAIVRRSRPEVERVTGGSWLYSTSSYRSLFPVAHVTHAVVRRQRRTFQGMSHWGQFLNHRGQIRRELADEFCARVTRWEGDDPCALFPINTLEVDSPVEIFDKPSR